MVGPRGKRRGGAKLSVRQKKSVIRLMNVGRELKYFVTNRGVTNITTTCTLDGTSFDIPQSAGASTDTSRIGDSITWCGTMEMNLQVTNGQGATSPNYCNARFILMQWHDVTTATPQPLANGSQVLLAGPSGTQDIYSLYNHDFRHQYTILYDNTFKLTGVGINGIVFTNVPVTDDTTSGVHKIRVDLNKMAAKNVQYVGGGGQGRNRIFLITVSDSNAAAPPTYIFSTKVFFRDA
jgi:hypothetical protein